MNNTITSTEENPHGYNSMLTVEEPRGLITDFDNIYSNYTAINQEKFIAQTFTVSQKGTLSKIVIGAIASKKSCVLTPSGCEIKFNIYKGEITDGEDKKNVDVSVIYKKSIFQTNENDITIDNINIEVEKGDKLTFSLEDSGDTVKLNSALNNTGLYFFVRNGKMIKSDTLNVMFKTILNTDSTPPPTPPPPTPTPTPPPTPLPPTPSPTPPPTPSPTPTPTPTPSTSEKDSKKGSNWWNTTYGIITIIGITLAFAILITVVFWLATKKSKK